MMDVETRFHQVPEMLDAIEQTLDGWAGRDLSEFQSLLDSLIDALLLVRTCYDRTGNSHPAERRARLYAVLCHAEDDVDHVMRVLILEQNRAATAISLPRAVAAVRRAWDVLQ